MIAFGDVYRINRNVVVLFAEYNRIMKYRRMSWAGHVARIGEKRNACRL
jgi:hypothetical protein